MDCFLIPKATVINLFIGSSRDTVSLRSCGSAGGKQLHESPGSGAGGDAGRMGAGCGGAEWAQGGQKVPPGSRVGGQAGISH